MLSGPKIINGLSVDIEDWFQVGAFENTIKRTDWEALERRVEHNTDAVINLFARAGVKGTFFTLGWVAKRHPGLMRRIVDAGHEVASHGFDHQRVFTMTADEFADDIGKTRKILEDATGQPVTGYRAPSFSIDTRTPWAHGILAEHGYSYSSSIAPIRHDHYGWPEAPRFAHNPVPGAQLIEIPVTTISLFGRNFAAGGGGFFRVLPYALHRWMTDRVHSKDEKPVNFYFHPWDMDPGQPRVANAPLRSKLRHYTKLDAMEDKIARLLSAYHWGRMDELAVRSMEQAV